MFPADPSLVTQLNTSQLFIFDFDGTLVNLEQLNYSALQNVLEKYFSRQIDLPTYKHNIAGVKSVVGVERAFKIISKRYNLDLPEYDWVGISNEFRAHKRAAIKKSPDEISELVSGADNLIPMLKSRGKNIAVASSSSIEFIRRLLDHYGLLHYIEHFVTSEDVSNGKPHPEAYNRVLEHFKMDAAEAIAFEDSKFGLQSAKAAGLYVVGIRNPGWNDDFVEELASTVIEDFNECAKLIK